MMTFQLQKKTLKNDYAKFMIDLANETQNIDCADAVSAYNRQMLVYDSQSDPGYVGTTRPLSNN